MLVERQLQLFEKLEKIYPRLFLRREETKLSL